MSTGAVVRLTVDVPVPGVRVVRVNGSLGREGVARLARTVDAQLLMAGAGRDAIDHLVLDVGGVTDYDPDAFGALRAVGDVCTHSHVRLHLAGILPRPSRLPVRVRQQLARLSTFPTVEAALRSLGCVPPEPG